jgi:transcription elongation factor Elf1
MPEDAISFLASSGRHRALAMPNLERHDPELLPIGRPRCPKCKARMVTTALVEEPEGFERRTFECQRCGHSEEKVVAVDPLKSEAVGWTDSELRPAQDPIRDA